VNAPSIATTEFRAPALLHHARELMRALIGTRAIDVGDDVVDLSLSEGVAPWLGARLAQQRVSVPPARAEQLLWEHQMCLAANLVRIRAARAFAERCQGAGIAVAWLKGMAMIHGIIAPGARSMTDVDLLVPARRWHEACALAGSLPGAHELSPPSRGYTATHDYVRAFGLPSGVTLEVHRFVCEASLFAIDYDSTEGLFAGAVPGPAGVSALAEEDLFLTLAAHAAKHTFELPLRSFLDGIVLMQRGRLNVDRLQLRAKQWRMEKALRLWVSALVTLAPSLATPPDEHGVPLLAGLFWSRTSELVAWQRFVRLVWIVDRPVDWARHVLTRAAFRLRDVARI